jgi:transposase
MPLSSPFPGVLSVFVMDNARIHHGEGIMDLSERFGGYLSGLSIRYSQKPLGVRIEFLPSYSPDLNPIEEAFSKVKAFIHRHRAILVHEGDGMLFDLMQIMEVVNAEDATGYFIHAGYF